MNSVHLCFYSTHQVNSVHLGFFAAHQVNSVHLRFPAAPQVNSVHLCFYSAHQVNSVHLLSRHKKSSLIKNMTNVKILKKADITILSCLLIIKSKFYSEIAPFILHCYNINSPCILIYFIYGNVIIYY